MQPSLDGQEYVFVSISLSEYAQLVNFVPKGMFIENEGATLIITVQQARELRLEYHSIFRCITLNIHSSLDAVGLTAAVSSALAKENISANVVAAFYHDHVFVNKKEAEDAIKCLVSLSNKN